MGTNYYIANLEDPQDDPPGWHIGKQSAGHPWCWADPPEGETIAERWLHYAETHPGLAVVDEYGEPCGSLSAFTRAHKRRSSDFHQPGKGWS